MSRRVAGREIGKAPGTVRIILRYGDAIRRAASERIDRSSGAGSARRCAGAIAVGGRGAGRIRGNPGITGISRRTLAAAGGIGGGTAGRTRRGRSTSAAAQLTRAAAPQLCIGAGRIGVRIHRTTEGRVIAGETTVHRIVTGGAAGRRAGRGDSGNPQRGKKTGGLHRTLRQNNQRHGAEQEEGKESPDGHGRNPSTSGPPSAISLRQGALFGFLFLRSHANPAAAPDTMTMTVSGPVCPCGACVMASWTTLAGPAPWYCQPREAPATASAR